ncbi:MAG: ABC transporter ATP-binding protein [Betaproteobacteria bacterium]|nr:ABC transporter ATP-binding protein [Betaproteobacteria bacterium]
MSAVIASPLPPLPGAADTVLQVAGLSVDYATSRGPVHAVRDISFAIRRGETFGVVGESGSGKSTLAFAVMGYLSENGRVTGGRIDYQGQDLLAMPRARQDELRGAKIAMVYQDPMSSLNPSLQVGIQVAEALLAHERISREAARARTLELFAAVNMPEPAAIALRYPHQLSGGQQQRVLIAMALACNPDLLIMDEPTTGLDVTTEAQILDLIAALKHRFSSAILYISHNLGVIARVSDRIGVMYAGQMIEQGPVRSVFGRQLHPYTAGLLECLPNLEFGRKSRSLRLIRGMIPDLTRMPPGCSFEPRCPHARERCGREAPPLVEVAPDHASRCFFWQEQEQARLAAGNLPPVASQYEPAVPAGSTSLTLDPSPRGRGKSAAVSLLKVDALTKEYVDSNKLLGLFGSERVVHALDGVSLTLEANETLAVVGESGCGKTTLARCIVGLVEPTRGTIEFDGIPLGGTAGERDRELRRRLQMVFQNPDSTLNPRRSIGDALMRPLEMFRGLKGATARDAAGELLRAVRLDERYLDRLPNQLSGGEKQRVGIARAFATNPDLIVCDEPVSALDVSVQAAILNLLGELQARERTAYLFISHDMSVVRYLADRVAVVYLGRICEVGPVERVFAPPYHPYTEALLSAVPVPDPDAEVNPIRLEGPVPSAANPPSGCVFHTRCPRKIGAICEQQTPPAQTGTDGHVIVCHIPSPSSAMKAGRRPAS